MSNLQSNFTTALGEWVLALGVIVATLFVTETTRMILQRLQKNQGWEVLRQLIPATSNILYILGLRIFADVAPLSGKVAIWFDSAVYLLSIVIFLGLVQRAAITGVQWSITKASQSETLQRGFIPLVRNVITLFIFLSGGIMVLKHFNYDVMSLVTALGVGSLAVGLAAKDTLSNMISGFILIIDRNLRPGDRINLGGSIGDVEEIGLRSTRIRVSDGNILIVPNAELVNTKILNLSLPTREIACSLSLRVPYDIPFAEVKKICLSILQESKKISQQRSKSIHLANLAEGHQLIQIGFWVPDMGDAAGTVSEVNEAIAIRFQQEAIPFFLPLNPDLNRR
jgi:small-conductance mechanosensitive channel